MDAQQDSHGPGTRPKVRTTLTLIGALVAMTGVALLASFTMAVYRQSIIIQREAALRQNLLLMHEAIAQYYADKNRYPATLTVLVDERYLRSVPQDPFTGSPETWQTVPSEPAPARPSADIGVVKVMSGSDGMALDGSHYRDW